MEWSEAIRYSIIYGDSITDLRQKIVQINLSGVDKADIFNEIYKIRDSFVYDGNEDAENMALDILDLLEGWCAPDMRI